MRWLILSPYLPHAAIGHGGGISIYHLARTLARDHEVTILCFERRGEERARQDLPTHGIRIETVPLRSDADPGLRRGLLVADRLGCLVRAWGRGAPYMVEKYRRPAMSKRLAQLIGELRPHVLQVEYNFMAAYAREAQILFDKHPSLWHGEARTQGPAHFHVLLNTHEAGTLPRLRRLASPTSNWMRWRTALELATWVRFERKALSWADTVLCVTEQDRVLLQALDGAANLMTLPLGVDADGLAPPWKPGERRLIGPPRMLFVGSFRHPPNAEAARVLVDRVLPVVQRSLPNILLEIVGRDPPGELIEAARRSDGAIRIHGFVDDLRPLFGGAWLFAAPLLSGGGIKIKILEAMARGAPVLTTPIGIEGIDAAAGQEIALARDVDEFAREAVRLLQSPQELMRLGDRGRQRALERYSWAAIVRALARSMEECAGTGSG